MMRIGYFDLVELTFASVAEEHPELTLNPRRAQELQEACSLLDVLVDEQLVLESGITQEEDGILRITMILRNGTLNFHQYPQLRKLYNYACEISFSVVSEDDQYGRMDDFSGLEEYEYEHDDFVRSTPAAFIRLDMLYEDLWVTPLLN